MQSQNRVAVIAGSGARFFAAADLDQGAPVDTPWGPPSAPVRRARLGGHPLLWLARHGEPHAIAPHRVNYRANIHALHASGATHVIALNTVGGISPEATTGSLWLPRQIIDYTAGRESSFHDGVTLPLQHQEFADPYDDGLRDLLARAAADADVPITSGGVYGCTQGPRLETSAEIRRMQRDGCDLVGMTGMPEAVLAREFGLAYASVSMVVNPAAGLSAEPITLDAILREAEGCMGLCMRLLARALALLVQPPG
jgi:5'-methylthioinosine phosphorylase